MHCPTDYVGLFCFAEKFFSENVADSATSQPPIFSGFSTALRLLIAMKTLISLGFHVADSAIDRMFNP